MKVQMIHIADACVSTLMTSVFVYQKCQNRSLTQVFCNLIAS